MFNAIAWGAYFVQTCFSGTSSVLCEKDGVCETIQRVITDGQCCVCDPDEKNDRCCSFDRTFRSSPAFFCYGHINDSEHMSGKKYDATRLAATFKTILFIFACIFGIVGFICMIAPNKVVFSVIVADEFREQLGLQEEKSSAKDEQIHKDTVMSMLKSSMSGLSSMFDNEEEISKEELAKIQKQLQQVETHLIYTKPETVAVTEPTSLMGGSMLFYAALCVYQLMMDLNQIIDMKNIYVHWLWFVCGLVAIVTASSGHGRNLENSNFVTILIVCYVVGMFTFGILERKFHGFIQKHGKMSKPCLSESDEIEME